MNRRPQILICDDDSLFHLSVKQLVKNQPDVKPECKSAFNCDEALIILKNYDIDVIFLDIQMRTENEGLVYIPRLREESPESQIIITSGRTDFSTVKEAMRLGATDYVPKDFNPDDLLLTLEQALAKKKLIIRNGQRDFETQSTQKSHVLIGQSPAMQKLRRTIDKMRASSANVVITGETGTGKEVVARNLRGILPDGSLAPFVAVDAATIQSSTAESQLFGHEKGAFTGADRTVKGIFEEANGGIVYFDEVANMPLPIQAKLLRVLQEKEISRMGSTKVIGLDFRVISATNRRLDEMAETGEFKDDLLQRLNVLPIEIPPLRDRKEDIPGLIEHFLGRAKARGLSFSDEATACLMAYAWPGNIRELSNMISYLAVMADTAEVQWSDLPQKIRNQVATPFAGTSDAAADSLRTGTATTFYDRISRFEEQLLALEYAKQDGNVSRLAVSLGMDRSHLYSKLREHGVHPRV